MAEQKLVRVMYTGPIEYAPRGKQTYNGVEVLWKKELNKDGKMIAVTEPTDQGTAEFITRGTEVYWVEKETGVADETGGVKEILMSKTAKELCEIADLVGGIENPSKITPKSNLVNVIMEAAEVQKFNLSEVFSDEVEK